MLQPLRYANMPAADGIPDTNLIADHVSATMSVARVPANVLHSLENLVGGIGDPAEPPGSFTRVATHTSSQTPTLQLLKLCQRQNGPQMGAKVDTAKVECRSNLMRGAAGSAYAEVFTGRDRNFAVRDADGFYSLAGHTAVSPTRDFNAANQDAMAIARSASGVETFIVGDGLGSAHAAELASEAFVGSMAACCAADVPFQEAASYSYLLLNEARLTLAGVEIVKTVVRAFGDRPIPRNFEHTDAWARVTRYIERNFISEEADDAVPSDVGHSPGAGLFSSFNFLWSRPEHRGSSVPWLRLLRGQLQGSGGHRLDVNALWQEIWRRMQSYRDQPLYVQELATTIAAARLWQEGGNHYVQGCHLGDSGFDLHRRREDGGYELIHSTKGHSRAQTLMDNGIFQALAPTGLSEEGRSAYARALTRSHSTANQLLTSIGAFGVRSGTKGDRTASLDESPVLHLQNGQVYVLRLRTDGVSSKYDAEDWGDVVGMSQDAREMVEASTQCVTLKNDLVLRMKEALHAITSDIAALEEERQELMERQALRRQKRLAKVEVALAKLRHRLQRDFLYAAEIRINDKEKYSAAYMVDGGKPDDATEIVRVIRT